MIVTINIGLNNNPKSIEEIISVLEDDFGKVDFHIAEGKFNGIPEPTLVAKFEDLSLSKTVLNLEALCIWTNQICIAVETSKNQQFLVYDLFYSGDFFKFDEALFIRF